MKSRNLGIFLVLLAIICSFLISSSAIANGLYDGEWEGETFTGMPVEFTVENNVVTNLYYRSTYNCPTGSTSCWGHYRHPNIEIQNDSFTYYGDIEDSHIIDGKIFPSIIQGNFDTLTTVSGSIKAGCATYKGIGLSTQSCVFLDNCTAQKISDLILSPDSKVEEYNQRLD